MLASELRDCAKLEVDITYKSFLIELHDLLTHTKFGVTQN